MRMGSRRRFGGRITLRMACRFRFVCHSQSGPTSSAKNVDASKIAATTLGKPPGPDLNTTPFPFGIVVPTGDNGTNFPTLIGKRDG